MPSSSVHTSQAGATSPRKASLPGGSGAPRLLIIYTGGTIGMVRDPKTGALAPFDFDHLLDNVPRLARLGYSLGRVQFHPAIDSSNMSPAHWAAIAHAIEASYASYDGFVVLHGTDTMAYTASALSFMLENLEKPVIVTGSQLPISDIREDGTTNLITALQIAAAKDEDGKPMVREVAISFGDTLVRGNRATKASSTEFGAFRSFNYPALATMNLHIRFREELLWRPRATGAFATHTALDPAVSVVFLHPGITEGSLRAQLAEPGIKAFVLRTYGAGNAPTTPWFISAIADAVREGRIIVNVTQCPDGGVEETRYDTGDALAEAGAVSGYDLTCEAAVTKLMYLLGQGLSPADVARAMQRSLRGELTVPGAEL